MSDTFSDLRWDKILATEEKVKEQAERFGRGAVVVCRHSDFKHYYDLGVTPICSEHSGGCTG